MVFSLRHKAEKAAHSVEALLVEAERAVMSVVHGGHARRRSGSGETFWQFREYGHDDEPRMIDWRQSAKGGRVYVKQKEWETAQTILFWCLQSKGMNFSSVPDKVPTKLECAQVLSLAIALLSVQSGENIGSIYAARSGHSEKSIAALADILSAPADEVLPDLHRAQPSSHAQLVLCGDFLNALDDIETCFQTLGAAERRGIVVQVLDPAELDLPYQGRAQFVAPQGGDILDVDHVSSVRARYQDRIQGHCAALEALCAQMGWIYVLHRSDADIVTTLRALVQQIAERAA